MSNLPLLHNTYALLQIMTDYSLSCLSHVGMDNIFYLPEVVCPQNHADLLFVGASDMCQESAYTGKLQELTTGTSQRSSSLCTKQRNNNNHKILPSWKQYPKRCFLLRKLLRNIPCLSRAFLSKEYPTDSFFSGNFSRKIFCCTTQNG